MLGSCESLTSIASSARVMENAPRRSTALRGSCARPLDMIGGRRLPHLLSANADEQLTGVEQGQTSCNQPRRPPVRHRLPRTPGRSRLRSWTGLAFEAMLARKRKIPRPATYAICQTGQLRYDKKTRGPLPRVAEYLASIDAKRSRLLYFSQKMTTERL